MTDPSDPAGSTAAGQSEIQRLVGVYDADGSWRGELAYWVGARLGRAHCALCEITHGLARERAEWRECRAAMPVPFATYHRDDQPDAVRRIAGADLPTVVAETDGGIVVLLGPEQLARCAGSVRQLSDAIETAATREHLAWPGSSRPANPRW